MRVPTVVPVNALGQAALLFDPVVTRAQVHPFVLDRPPQPLNKDVVMAASSTVHADLDAVVLEHLGEFGAGELTRPYEEST